MAAPTRAPASLKALLHDGIDYHLKYSLAKQTAEVTPYDYFRALALSLRQSLIDGLWQTEERYRKASAKRMYYISMEFLVGRSLRSTLSNLGIYEECRGALEEKGIDLAAMLEAEPDAALGNGGLGRLAACFLESLASLGMPGFGYGINYEFGLFRQEITNGYQSERPDHWLSSQSPWLIERGDQVVRVPVYGRVEHGLDRDGNYNPMWMDWQFLIGVPYDMPVVGYGGECVNWLRLYSARSSNEFDMTIFNAGDYIRAVQQKIASENISKVLYPSDAVWQGKELRLLQEYFMVGCALRDIMENFQAEYDNFEMLPRKVAIQLNDTHPALVVAELMRTLVDEKGIPWERAWEWTTAVCGYTNHTLLPEALEKWPVALVERVLPRHMQIIYEINHRFLNQVRLRWPEDEARVSRMSLIEEGGEKQVRMANLSIVGSHAVNGVSALHSRLVVESLVPEFAEMWPSRFHNKTNGVTHRRWLLESNPRLSKLLTGRIGDVWIQDPSRLGDLRAHVNSAEVQEEFLASKHACKTALAGLIRDTTTWNHINPDFLFDVQVKRIHAYKRQLLNAMGIVWDFLRLVEDGKPPLTPTVHLFAGKAAPGYFMAKMLIKLIHNVAAAVDREPRARDHMAVVFLPDYKVSLAEKIIPAADLSEQISTAGMEASGTGNMKLALNGALTIGTLDGANVEIGEAVGWENIYIFGLTAAQVNELREQRSYRPWHYYRSSEAVCRVVDAIRGRFCPGEGGVFEPVCTLLMADNDPFVHLADFEAYLAAREKAAQDYQDRAGWARRALINVASMGHFSSDRTISEYARETWDIRSYR